MVIVYSCKPCHMQMDGQMVKRTRWIQNTLTPTSLRGAMYDFLNVWMKMNVKKSHKQYPMIRKHAMVQLSWKFCESAPNPHWAIMLTSESEKCMKMYVNMVQTQFHPIPCHVTDTLRVFWVYLINWWWKRNDSRRCQLPFGLWPRVWIRSKGSAWSSNNASQS